jgi:hypothetical protein
VNHRKPGPLDRAPALAVCIALISTAAVLSACSPESGRDATTTTRTASRKLSIGEFQLGTRLGSHGGIARQANTTVFSTDQTIHVAMRLRDAPAGTTVKVVWKSPAGEALGAETKRLQPGQDYMHFSADGANLLPGTGYGAEISANDGEPVTVVRFDMNSGG